MRLTAAERAAGQTVLDWNANPLQFIWDNFKVEVDPWALEAIEAYRQPGKRRVGLQASVGVGKSALKAMLGWHFISTNGDQIKHEGKFPNGYALSISRENLESGLWKELGVWYERSDFLKSQFNYSAQQITHKRHPLNWWLRARSYRQSADPDTQGAALSGLHSPWAMVLLDEVGEMNPVLGRRAEQVLSDAECEVGVIFASGNPTSQSGLLYDIANRSGWTIIRVSGDPDDPRRSSRVDKAWAREQIKEFGRDNPWVMAHVLGKFPPGGLNTLLTPDEVREAMTNRNPPEPDWIWAQRRIGIDVARFGDDRTILFPRQGLVAFRPVTMRGARTDAITARALNMIGSFKSEAEFVDDSGHWGHGVVDGLLAARRSVRAVIFEDKAAAPQYFNRRAEMWFTMAEWVKRGGSLPNIPEMIPELTRVQYGFQGGKIIIQPKAEVKKLIGVSPDLADALALTFAEPDLPSQSSMDAMGMNGGGQLITDYDPHADFRHLR